MPRILVNNDALKRCGEYNHQVLTDEIKREFGATVLKVGEKLKRSERKKLAGSIVIYVDDANIIQYCSLGVANN